MIGVSGQIKKIEIECQIAIRQKRIPEKSWILN
jgi:hypothetical protein